MFDLLSSAINEKQIDPDMGITGSDDSGNYNKFPVGELLPSYLSSFARYEGEIECIEARAGEDLIKVVEKAINLPTIEESKNPENWGGVL